MAKLRRTTIILGRYRDFVYISRDADDSWLDERPWVKPGQHAHVLLVITTSGIYRTSSGFDAEHVAEVFIEGSPNRDIKEA